MQLIISARNFELTEPLKSFIEEKFEKINKFTDVDQQVRVTLETQKHRHAAEAVMYYQGHLIKTEVSDTDMYSAIDMLRDKLKSHLKLQAHKARRNQHDSIRYTTPILESEENSEMNQTPRITKRKFFDMKPMSEEEAILQMELLNHQAFMFFNADTETMCLLYKRKDANYGLIEGTP